MSTDSDPDCTNTRLDVDLGWGDYIALAFAMAQTVLLPFLVAILVLLVLLVLVLLFL